LSSIAFVLAGWSARKIELHSGRHDGTGEEDVAPATPEIKGMSPEEINPGLAPSMNTSPETLDVPPVEAPLQVAKSTPGRAGH
jgi:hypothetical protein